MAAMMDMDVISEDAPEEDGGEDPVAPCSDHADDEVDGGHEIHGRPSLAGEVAQPNPTVTTRRSTSHVREPAGAALFPSPSVLDYSRGAGWGETNCVWLGYVLG